MNQHATDFENRLARFTAPISKICRKCGAEFFVPAYLAPKTAFDWCADCVAKRVEGDSAAPASADASCEVAAS